MLKGLLRALLHIRNYERIPKLPRGMLASEYKALSREDARVMARLGARSPSGVHIALQRAGVDRVEELMRGLKHYRPQRHIRRRWNRIVNRFLLASDDEPHRQDVLADARRDRRRGRHPEVEQRLKALREQSGS